MRHRLDQHTAGQEECPVRRVQSQSAYKRQLQQLALKEREYCGRHRTHFARYYLKDGVLVTNRCYQCELLEQAQEARTHG